MTAANAAALRQAVPRLARSPVGLRTSAGFGADADHLKTAADVAACAAAGFTGFTIDPGGHVDSRADSAGDAELRAAWDRLPWGRLEDTAADQPR